MGDLAADYTIEGGGLTGCAIAARLHRGDPSLRVLVLEAGIDATNNPQIKDLGGAFALAGSELDYKYKSIPQPNTNDRSYDISAGKVLGGGGILNYGAWARGDATDYDEWARVVGDERWSYKDLLLYLKKAERHLETKQNPEHRRSNGPITINSVIESNPKRRYGLREPIRLVWGEMGLKQNPRGDCGSLPRICELLETWKDRQ